MGWACRKGCTEGGRLRVAFMADEPLLWMRMACLYTCPMKQHCTYATTMSFAQHQEQHHLSQRTFTRNYLTWHVCQTPVCLVLFVFACMLR